MVRKYWCLIVAAVQGLVLVSILVWPQGRSRTHTGADGFQKKC